MRRLIAAILFTALSTAVGAPLTCAGWEPSPEARRECCLRAHHEHCEDQATADACCAGGEQGQQPLSISALVTAAGLAYPAAIVVPTFEPTSVWHASAAQYSTIVAKRLHGPPDLLIPPLHI